MSGGKATDIRVTRAELYLLPVRTRMPIKFGPEVLTEVTCARVRLTVEDRTGRTAVGWGETPLSVQWAWPSSLTYGERHDRMVELCRRLTHAWAEFHSYGHPLELGSEFIESELNDLAASLNSEATEQESLPYLAALVCSSPFDVALHDAFGNLHQRDIYDLYGAECLNRDLSALLEPAVDTNVSFAGRYPDEFLQRPAKTRLKAWHLVAGLDPLTESDLTGDEPDDGHPVVLTEWIKQDKLDCLKVKLRGSDQAWDLERLIRVGQLAIEYGATWLTADLNCTVLDPDYVTGILDQLCARHPRIYGMLLYIEQPFPYDLDRHAIDARSIAARKPVYLDESAHDWQHVRRGRELGWSGVALKTCKTQTGAILSLCWAKAHGMPVMVQDLANPMLAQIAHLRLAAHAGTLIGSVETNSMQFYPDASKPEAVVHPDMFRRLGGSVDLSTLGPTGMGYRVEEIARDLPQADVVARK